jgi:hypothetical protein
LESFEVSLVFDDFNKWLCEKELKHEQIITVFTYHFEQEACNQINVTFEDGFVVVENYYYDFPLRTERI